jgi:hypothetical protein
MTNLRDRIRKLPRPIKILAQSAIFRYEERGSKSPYTIYKAGVSNIPVVMKYDTVFDGQYFETMTLNEGHKDYIILSSFGSDYRRGLDL